MNTLRIALRWLGLPLLALCLLAPPASAQNVVKKKIVKADTSETDNQTVVIEIEDGRRSVTVNGEKLSDEEAEAFLKEENVWMDDEGERHVLRSGPMRRRMAFTAPRMLDMARELEGPRAFVFDHEGMDGFKMLEDFSVFGGEDGDFRVEMRGSMKEHAEIARMDVASRRLAMEVRKAEGAERERLEQELRQQLDEIFERKQALRAEHIERLRQQLEAVTGEQQERQQARNEIIERRLKKLLGQDDKYDW